MNLLVSVGRAAFATMLFGATPVTAADDAPFDGALHWIELDVTPAPLPVPALREQLLPPFESERTGNAAVAYLKATLSLPIQERVDTAYAWRSAPLDALRDVRLDDEALGGMLLYGFLETGAQCASCDWETRVQPEWYDMMAPELSRIRTAAVLASVRARVQMARGDLDGALDTLRVGYALASDLAEGPTVLQGLVGSAVASVYLETTAEFIGRDGAPNLYWAFTTLPDPLIDVRRTIRNERALMDEIAPRIRDIRAGRVADDEWNEVAADLIQGIGDVGPLSGDARLTAMTWGMASYPAARQRLIDSGRAASDVDAMPTMAVLLTDAVREFDLARDELYKWLNLPYPDAVGPLRAAAARLEGAAQPGGRGWPFLRLLPALDRVLYNEAALQRRIAAHRCIEAMRAYAETHGAWPADLDAITDLPIPRDPVTGAPFQYRRLGPDRAELAAPHPAHERDADRLRFRLQLIP